METMEHISSEDEREKLQTEVAQLDSKVAELKEQLKGDGAEDEMSLRRELAGAEEDLSRAQAQLEGFDETQAAA